jgi:hypothetical protein
LWSECGWEGKTERGEAYSGKRSRFQKDKGNKLSIQQSRLSINSRFSGEQQGERLLIRESGDSSADVQDWVVETSQHSDRVGPGHRESRHVGRRAGLDTTRVSVRRER